MRRRDFIGLLGGAAAWPLGASTWAESAPVEAAAPAEPSAAERAAMAEAAEAFMQRYAVPGLSVAVGHSGRLVYQDAFGWSDRAASEPATPAHLFRIASISKSITSVAAFMLIEEGRLSLSDRVFGRSAVLGTDYGQQPYPAMVEEVTIEHLLTHTCGGWSNQDRDPMFNNKQMNHAQLIDWTLRNRPLENPPGRAYAYSNFGYCLLGRVIERITRRPYADYVGDAVLRRCGITDMAIAGNTLAQRRRGEVKYYGQNGEDPYGMNVARMDSHGGWVASPASLVQFAMHVGGFAKPVSIIKPATIAAMTTSSPLNANYARGWRVNRSNNWWHTGSLPGTCTIMVRVHTGFCWAAVANSRDTVAAKSLMPHDLDRLLWTMVRKVKSWRA